ncbi:DUF192 domain-containing protein [Roseateles sp. DC23W]|uniref:DUF192 domain-containing protein n=1 Tax=Pelomonas dachongensis TaxID=3299029 RepID=A0ABW7EH29_9BURK
MTPLPLLVEGRPAGVRVGLADRWHQRARGLLGVRRLDDPAGLWITPCNSVHMLGMRIALDVAFVDRSGVILKLVPHLAPWRFAACTKAHATVELRVGLIAQFGLRAGQRLTLG